MIGASTMKNFTRIAAALAVGFATFIAASPAHSDTSTDLPPHGYTQTTLCVVRTDYAAKWHVAGAVRAWNAAQTYVHLSMVAVPGCDVLEIREFAGPEHPDWNGYTDWPDGWEFSSTYQRAAYHHARVWLSRAVRDETTKPYWKGERMGCFRKSVVAHEIGHALGLGHTTGTESVMSPNRDWYRYCGTPSAGDAAMIPGLYTPVASEGDGVGADDTPRRVSDHQHLILR